MKKTTLTRRDVIKAGGITLALPFLEAMIPSIAKAAGAVDPKRYVCMYIPSGTYMKPNDGAFWQPRSAGLLDSNNLPEVFRPFAGNAANFSILRGVKNSSQYQCQGITGGHASNVSTYLTCSPYSDGGAAFCTLTGSSFDQLLALQKGLKAYAMSGGGYDGYHPDLVNFDYGRTVSYLNGNQAETWLDPYKLFYSSGLFQNYDPNAVVAPAPGTAPTAAPQAPLSPFSRNKSILDNALSAISDLKSRLGAADRRRLDDYFTGLRNLEMSVVALPPPPQPPPNPGGSPPPPNQCGGVTPPNLSLNNEDHSGNQDDFAARMKAFCDIMILSFKCDRAQVFSLMTEYENTNRRFRNLIPGNLVYGGANVDVPGSHNEMAHWGDGGAGEETERRNRCVSRDRFYMSFVDYLMTALKNSQDPSGSSILDNTIIQFGHGLEDGNHGFGGGQAVGLPLILAGGRNMINPGNLYDLQGVDLKDLYFTLSQKFGMNISNFQGSSRIIEI